MKKNLNKLIPILVVVIYLLLHIIYLDKYPPIWADDNLFAEPAYIFSQTGNLIALSGWAGEPNIKLFIEGRLFYIPRIILFKLIELSPFIARLPSYIFGILCLYMLYNLSKYIFNREIAFISVCMMSFSQNFIFHFHDNRPETMLLFFMLVSVYIFLINVKRNFSILWFILGILISLSLDIHPSGLITGIIVLGLFIHNIRLINFKKYVFILPGILCGFIWFIATRLPINTNKFLNQYESIYNNKIPSLLNITSPVDIFLWDFQRYYTFFWEARMHRNLFLLVIWIVVLFYSLRKKEFGQKISLLSLLYCYIFYLFFTGNNSSCYLIYAFVFLYVLTAKMIYDLIKSNLKMYKITGFSLLFLLGLFYFAESSYIFWVYKNSDYNNYIEKLLIYIPKKSVVYGDIAFWFGFNRNGIPYYPRYGKANINLEEIILKRNITYILYNNESEFWKFNNDKIIQSYLKNNCEYIGTVIDEFYGGPMNWRKGRYKTDIYKVLKQVRNIHLYNPK